MGTREMQESTGKFRKIQENTEEYKNFN